MWTLRDIGNDVEMRREEEGGGGGARREELGLSRLREDLYLTSHSQWDMIEALDEGAAREVVEIIQQTYASTLQGYGGSAGCMLTSSTLWWPILQLLTQQMINCQLQRRSWKEAKGMQSRRRVHLIQCTLIQKATWLECDSSMGYFNQIEPLTREERATVLRKILKRTEKGKAFNVFERKLRTHCSSIISISPFSPSPLYSLKDERQPASQNKRRTVFNVCVFGSRNIRLYEDPSRFIF